MKDAVKIAIAVLVLVLPTIAGCQHTVKKWTGCSSPDQFDGKYTSI